MRLLRSDATVLASAILLFACRDSTSTTVPAERVGGPSAHASATSLDVVIDPGAFPGSWSVQGVTSPATGAQTVSLDPGTYDVFLPPFGEIHFTLASDGTVTAIDAGAATGGDHVLTFRNVAVTFDAGAYSLAWSIGNVVPAVAGSRVIAMVPTVQEIIEFGAGILESELYFVVGTDGTVTPTYNAAAALGGAGTLTFNMASITVDPVAFAGNWIVSPMPSRVSGLQTIPLILGVTYTIDFGLGVPESSMRFAVNADASVTSGNATAATGGIARLTFRNSTVGVTPSTPTASWGIWQVTAATGASNATLVPGLSYALTSPAAPGVFDRFALADPCAVAPSSFALAGVTFSLSCPTTAAIIAALITQSVQNAGVANALLSKLNAITNAIASGNAAAKTGAVTAFINQVNAITGKKISATDAALLIQLVLQL